MSCLYYHSVRTQNNIGNKFSNNFVFIEYLTKNILGLGQTVKCIVVAEKILIINEWRT